MNDKGWETLTKKTDPIIASLLQGRLQAEGIPAIIRTGEAAGSLYGLTTGPLAEIKILVPVEKISEARRLLEQIEDENETDSPGDFEEEPENA